MPEPFYYLIAVIALGGFMHGATGFGFALSTMPLLGPVVGMDKAVPMMNLMIILLSSQNLYVNRRSVHWGEVLRLMAASVPGLTLGVLFLRHGDPMMVRQLLGIILLAYGAYAIIREIRESGQLPLLEANPSSLMRSFAGISAGFFGGSCGADGPPVIVYGNMQHWPKERFRGNLQAFFLFNGVLLTVLNSLSGYLTSELFRIVLYALPFLVVGSILGHLAAQGVPAKQFRQGVLLLIILLGLNLLLN